MKVMLQHKNTTAYAFTYFSWSCFMSAGYLAYQFYRNMHMRRQGYTAA